MPFSIRLFRRLSLTYFSGFKFLITLLVLSSGPVYAEWALLIQTNQDGPNVYADSDSIRRKGKLVEMRAMTDFNTAQTDLNFSSLSSQLKSNTTEQRRAIGHFR